LITISTKNIRKDLIYLSLNEIVFELTNYFHFIYIKFINTHLLPYSGGKLMIGFNNLKNIFSRGRWIITSVVLVALFAFLMLGSIGFADPLHVVNVPEFEVDMVVAHWGAESYFDTTISGIGGPEEGYSVWDGTWVGWCVDESHYIYTGTTYPITLNSTYDPLMLWPDDDWDMVNYLLNHKDSSADKVQIQKAIWYFINGGYTGSDPVILGMITEAEINGDSFIPQVGQMCAVLCTTDEGIQRTFIEVQVSTCDNTCISFVQPLSNVDPDTSGWSNGDNMVNLNTNHWDLLGGTADVNGHENGNDAILTHRGTRGLGIYGNENDEVDSIDGWEHIDITFDEPRFINMFEVHSLFSGEGPSGAPEQGDVKLYLDDIEVGYYHLAGVEPLGGGNDGDVIQLIYPAILIDEIMFYIEPTEDYNSWSEFTVAKLCLLCLESCSDEVWVDDDADPGWYDFSHVASIQTGVDHVCDGGTVYVYDGTYAPFKVEGRNDISITRASLPIITGNQLVYDTTYSGFVNNVVFVNNSQNIDIIGFEIQGTNPGGRDYTVLYQSSSGMIKDCIVDSNSRGNMNALAIRAHINSVLTIEDCTIRDYGRIGIYCRQGTIMYIYDNTLIGQTYSTADGDYVNYGIEIEDLSSKSHAEIIGNEIYGHDYTDNPSWSSAGIIVDAWRYYMVTDENCSAIIEQNDIHDNYFGIEIVPNDDIHVNCNNIYDNRWYGAISSPYYDGMQYVNYILDANCNWWGDCSGPYNDTLNPYGQGDQVDDYVDYDPWVGKVVADASGPSTACINDMLQFYGSGSSTSGCCGETITYTWDFDDSNGIQIDSTDIDPTHAYNAYGSYVITLTVTTETLGYVCSDTDTIIVTVLAPIADANGPYTANIGNSYTVTLDGSGSDDPDGSIVLYEWDCDGDGTYDWSSATTGITTYTYPQLEYTQDVTVELRVTDDCGHTDTDTSVVTIVGNDKDPPIVQLSYPTGGEELSGTVTIKWFAIDSEDWGSPDIWLYYSADSGDFWNEIARNLENTIGEGAYKDRGEYIWNVGSLPTGNYILKIDAFDSDRNRDTDTSKPFTIGTRGTGLIVSYVTVGSSNAYIKNGDSLTIEAGITFGQHISTDYITADLSELGKGTSVPADNFDDGLTATWTVTNVECTPSDGPITITITATDGGSTDSNTATIIADNTIPELNIITPDNALYLRDKKLFSLNKPIIIGAITLEATAYDSSGVQKTEIYIDDELKETLTGGSEWYMNLRLIGRHTLKIVAYDNAGNINEYSQTMMVFNLFETD
jgi:hypothetical protein